MPPPARRPHRVSLPSKFHENRTCTINAVFDERTGAFHGPGDEQLAATPPKRGPLCELVHSNDQVRRVSDDAGTPIASFAVFFSSFSGEVVCYAARLDVWSRRMLCVMRPEHDRQVKAKVDWHALRGDGVRCWPLTDVEALTIAYAQKSESDRKLLFRMWFERE